MKNKKDRLTEHGHFGVFSHAAQRRMRVEPDHRGMHEKLSHRDLCDLREEQGTADSLRESRGRRTSQALSFVRLRLSVSVHGVTLHTGLCTGASPKLLRSDALMETPAKMHYFTSLSWPVCSATS